MSEATLQNEVNELVSVQIVKFKKELPLTTDELDECAARFMRIRALYEELDRLRGNVIQSLPTSEESFSRIRARCES